MADRIDIEVDEGARTSGLVYLALHERLAITLVLAHGAGAGQEHRFMVQFATALAARGVDVMTFNFLYVEQHRRVPDRTDKLESCYRAALAAACRHSSLTGNTVFIGGKSMGGRMATHLAAAAGSNAPGSGINGVVLLGYPLHPPGKPEQLRAAHLEKIRVPMLIVQGSRDPFGTPDELQPVLPRVPADVTLHVVEHGDHSLSPPRRGTATIEETYGGIQDVIVEWMSRRIRSSGGGTVGERGAGHEGPAPLDQAR